MEIDIFQQIFDQIKKAGRILVVLPQAYTPDAFSSGLALKLFLNKLNKEVDLVAQEPVLDQLSFLPRSNELKNAIPSGNSLIVKLDTSKKKIEELSYETSENQVSIFLKAKEDQFVPDDISFDKERKAYDLIFTLDAASLSDLGGLFEQNSEMFYEIPKINIDHKAENEFFGAINLVDLSATSIGEVLGQLFGKFEQKLIDEDIATCLLCGIISKTDSFQHPRTTPRAFLTASDLVVHGARQQDIIQFLYKTKSLNFLRLWGRVLARLKGKENQSFMYAVLTEQDFEKAEASQEDLPQALIDLLANVSGKLAVAIFAPANNRSAAYIALHNSLPQSLLAGFGDPKNVKNLSPHPYRLFNYELDQNTQELEGIFLESTKAV